MLAASPSRRDARLEWIAVGASLLAAAAVLWFPGRRMTFWFDEWYVIVHRRGPLGSALVDPVNGHLLAVPTAIYRALFPIAGLRHYGAFRAVGIAVHLAGATGVFLYARRRVPQVLALAMTVLVLFLGPAWQVLLWPGSLSLEVPFAAFPWILLVLDRRDRAGDVAAAILLLVAVTSGSGGLAVAAGVGVELLVGRAWRRLWVVGAPAVVWVVWFATIGAGAPGGPTLASLRLVPGYATRAAAAAVASVTATGGRAGAVILVVAAALLLVRVLRVRGDLPRLAGILAAAAAFWLALGLTRVGVSEPGSSRYLYGSGIFVVLAIVASLHGLRIARPVLGVLIAGLAVAIALNTRLLVRAGDNLGEAADAFRAEATALEVARSVVAPGLRPDPGWAPDLTAVRYFDATADLGSPAMSLAEITAAAEPVRAAADTELVRALGLRGVPADPPPASGGPAPAVEEVSGGHVAAQGACLTLTPTTGSARLRIEIPSGGLALDPGGSVEVALRRFASAFANVLPTTFGPATIEIPLDGSTMPWHGQVVASVPVRVCGIPSPS